VIAEYNLFNSLSTLNAKLKQSDSKLVVVKWNSRKELEEAVSYSLDVCKN
jgi:hypothetical protein